MEEEVVKDSPNAVNELSELDPRQGFNLLGEISIPSKR